MRVRAHGGVHAWQGHGLVRGVLRGSSSGASTSGSRGVRGDGKTRWAERGEGVAACAHGGGQMGWHCHAIDLGVKWGEVQRDATDTEGAEGLMGDNWNHGLG